MDHANDHYRSITKTPCSRVSVLYKIIEPRLSDDLVLGWWSVILVRKGCDITIYCVGGNALICIAPIMADFGVH